MKKKINFLEPKFRQCQFCFFMDTESMCNLFGKLNVKGFCTLHKSYVKLNNPCCDKYKYFFSEVSK